MVKLTSANHPWAARWIAKSGEKKPFAKLDGIHQRNCLNLILRKAAGAGSTVGNSAADTRPSISGTDFRPPDLADVLARCPFFLAYLDLYIIKQTTDVMAHCSAGDWAAPGKERRILRAVRKRHRQGRLIMVSSI